MLILLPPSEGKTAPRRGKRLDLTTLRFPALQEPRDLLLKALTSLCTPDDAASRAHAARLLHVGTTLAEEVARNARLSEAPTSRADLVYSGVLYDALDLASVDAAARRRATRSLVIFSGLFGLVTPADRIPAYRLSGDVKLPGVGAVSTYWSSHLDGAVREAARGRLIVDLRSSAYAPFWRPDRDTARRVVTLRVLHEVDGERKVVSHFNKATKGRIVRALLQDPHSPMTPVGFAEHLRVLGWTVEVGEQTRRGVALDVIVREI